MRFEKASPTEHLLEVQKSIIDRVQKTSKSDGEKAGLLHLPENLALFSKDSSGNFYLSYLTLKSEKRECSIPELNLCFTHYSILIDKFFFGFQSKEQAIKQVTDLLREKLTDKNYKYIKDESMDAFFAYVQSIGVDIEAAQTTSQDQPVDRSEVKSGVSSGLPLTAPEPQPFTFGGDTEVGPSEEIYQLASKPPKEQYLRHFGRELSDFILRSRGGAGDGHGPSVRADEKKKKTNEGDSDLTNTIRRLSR